ncbi:S8 family serine peptidase [Haloarchaeobius amylolyticus]|uniref:S8 family serine peptidase n=1 Tax=Haloarchaeobius amylolyticus TaxID=1198296 RepID=UPI00226F84CD|nr:S8 family serine peptidase [Haloarchaeobius amylolyticus]
MTGDDHPHGRFGGWPTDRGTARLVAVVCLVGLLVGGVGLFATSFPTDGTGSAGSASAIDPSANLSDLHDRSITGENVTVGVVDVTGFDTDHPAIADRVVAARSFAAGETVANDGQNAHGTAAASLVSRVAPDADLYLASFDTGQDYRRAMAWMVEQDVDVVVAPVTFYGKPDDGSARVDRVAHKAQSQGTLVVASAGNLGQSHWTGHFDPADGAHRFDQRLADEDAETEDRFEADTRNYLVGDGRREVSVWLSWEQARPDANLTLELYAEEQGGSRLVARSQPYRADDVPNERIHATLDPDESYYVTVTGGETATGVRFSLSSPTHSFEHRVRSGSIAAPATAEDVLAVGAYNGRTGRAEPFSGAGPVPPSRLGIDLVAPDRLSAANHPNGFVGSSAAAPYVAGVAALVLEVNPDASPATVQRLLLATASDVPPQGLDPVSGHGTVEPARAVAAAQNGTTQNRVLVMPSFSSAAIETPDTEHVWPHRPHPGPNGDG